MSERSKNDPYSIAEVLSSKTLPALDGFRMIAVMSVVFGHAGYSTFFSSRHGVAGFFVLSGFLITWLLLKEFEKSRDISFRNFYLRRSLRIFPAYYAFIVVSITWDLYRGNEDIEPLILPSLFYVVNYYNAIEGHSSASVSHLWSLAVEEQFYLVFPLLFLLLAKKGAKTLAIGLSSLIVLVLIWRTIAYSVLEWGSTYAYNAFDTRFDNLAIGCLAAVLLRMPNVQMLIEPLTKKSWAPFLTLGALWLSRAIPFDNYSYGLGFTIDAVLLALLLIQIMCLSRSGFWSWMNWNIPVYMGLISYPIYLWHGWALQAAQKIDPLPDEGQLFMGIVFCILAGTASYEFLEKPFLKLKKHFGAVQNKPGEARNSGILSGFR